MKKVVVLLLSLVLMLTLCACVKTEEKGTDSSSTQRETTASTEAKEDDDYLDDTDIENLVVYALYKKIDRKYEAADAGSCRYSINKIDRTSDKEHIYVYGSVTLYDKYGKTTSGYYGGSGTPYRSFEVDIWNGKLSNCTIK